jgi:hypothetical protein
VRRPASGSSGSRSISTGAGGSTARLSELVHRLDLGGDTLCIAENSNSAAQAVGTVRQCHLPDETVFQQISACKVPLPERGCSAGIADRSYKGGDDRERESDRDSDASGLKRPLGARLSAIPYFGRILCMPRGNPSPKLAITVDPEIHENILAAAARDRVSVSAWMTTAAREALKRRAGVAAVELWEKQHGRFTPEEMTEARRSVRAQLRTPRTVRRPA